MNGIKWILGLWIVAILCALLASGCATANTQVTHPNALALGASTLKIAARTGTVVAIDKEPKSRTYFETASLALTVVIDGGKYSHEDLAGVLSALKSEDPIINLAVADVLDVYHVTVAEAVKDKIDQQIIVATLLRSARDGIQSGLLFAPNAK